MGKQLKKLVKSIRAAYGYTADEQLIADAADKVGVAYGDCKKLCSAFLAAKGDVSAYLKKGRTFALDGVDTVVSVRDLKAGNDEQKKAARRFATLQTTFWRLGVENMTPTEKATAEKVAKKATAKKQAAQVKAVIEKVADSSKAVRKLVAVQVAALKEREKAPFDIPAAIAAWEALGAVYK